MTFSQKGVALVQVLIMTAIMSLIAIQFAQTARNQIAIASDFKDRLASETLVKTARSEILYNLFKFDSEQLSDQMIDGVKWNLRNTPFALMDNVTVKIQSLSGLLSLPSMPREMFKKVLLSLGATATQAAEVIASLKDWTDIDDNAEYMGAESAYYSNKLEITTARNGPLQHISELQFIKGMTPELWNKLRPLVTIYFASSFNPALAPHQLVNALFDTDTAARIIEAQKVAQFDQSTWSGIVGSRELEFIDIHPKSRFRVEIIVSINAVRLVKKFDILVQSQKKQDPLLILATY